MAAATTKLWSFKSWERQERQIVQYTAQDSVHAVLTWDFMRAECSLFRILLGRISRNATMEGKA